MSACYGPCQQGRKPCPCPQACEIEEEGINEYTLFGLGIATGVLITMLVILAVRML
jgi:hypothetical protein